MGGWRGGYKNLAARDCAAVRYLIWRLFVVVLVEFVVRLAFVFG